MEEKYTELKQLEQTKQELEKKKQELEQKNEMIERQLIAKEQYKTLTDEQREELFNMYVKRINEIKSKCIQQINIFISSVW